ncbi:hypothetical protein ACROYT_G012049 [Oculina patagonica]
MGVRSLGLGTTNKQQWDWNWDLGKFGKTIGWEMGFGQNLGAVTNCVNERLIEFLIGVLYTERTLRKGKDKSSFVGTNAVDSSLPLSLWFLHQFRNF